MMNNPRPRHCSICREDTHQTYQHVDPPDWDMNIGALCCVVIGMMGLLAVILVSLCSHN